MRQIIALVFFTLALPLVFVGLIDPLEGGLALLAALAVYVVGFGIAGRWPARYLWIPYVLAVVVGALVLTVAIVTLEPGPERGSILPLLIAGNWVYRVAVLATLVGGVLTVWFAIRDIMKRRRSADHG